MTRAGRGHVEEELSGWTPPSDFSNGRLWLAVVLRGKSYSELLQHLVE